MKDMVGQLMRMMRGLAGDIILVPVADAHDAQADGLLKFMVRGLMGTIFSPEPADARDAR